MKRISSKSLLFLIVLSIGLLVTVLLKEPSCTNISTTLKQNENKQRVDIIASWRQSDNHERGIKPEQSIEHRLRAVSKQVEDMWYYMQSSKLQSDNNADLIEELQSRKNAILVELELAQLLQKDTMRQKLDGLSTFVKKKIQQLQEPENCSSTKILICQFESQCGFGCQLHYVAVCFTLAVGMGRTLILDSHDWAYSKKPWEDVFMPISNSSCKFNIDDAVPWRSDMSESDINAFNIVKVVTLDWRSTPPYLPLRIPEYLYSELTRYHGDPAAWWMGHLVSYLIRPQPWLSTKISETERKVGFQNPVAGIHIRRTDKIKREAAYHDLSEYMVHVADWFKKESMRRQRMAMPPLEKKRVYIASDDPTVLDDARKRYPDYDFLGDKTIAVLDNTGQRYSLNGVIGVMTDVTILSKCDFFVGTFSSGMSRLVYELMQVQHVDPTNNARSLDDRYYYVQQFNRQQRAIYDHESQSRDQISMKVGDIINTRGDHWDGFSLGTNSRTDEKGLYPSYKAMDFVTAANFNLFKPLKQ